MTTFSEVDHKLNNLVASFECALVNVSIIYITMHKENAPINILSCSKAPKHNKFTDIQENQ